MSAWRSCLLFVSCAAALSCARHEDNSPQGASKGRGTTTVAEEAVLNLDVWSDYIAPDVIPNFERETGIEVHVHTFDSDPELETQLLMGHTGYDVVMPSGPFFRRQMLAGVYQTLDKSALSNYANLDPEIMRRLAEYDPGNEHAVPYMQTTVGIAYNIDMLHARLGPDIPDSWALLFDPVIGAKLKDCGVAYVDSPIQVFSAVIQYLGKDPKLLDPVNVAAASAVLRAVQPYMRYIHSTNTIPDLANGDICIALTWAGDAIQARERAKTAGQGVRIAYIIPREGGQMTIDATAIPSDAPHPRNALLWLNYLMRPDVIAHITNYLKYANGNAASMPLVSQDVKNDSGILPDAATRQRMINAVSATPEYSLIVSREWSRFRAGT